MHTIGVDLGGGSDGGDEVPPPGFEEEAMHSRGSMMRGATVTQVRFERGRNDVGILGVQFLSEN